MKNDPEPENTDAARQNEQAGKLMTHMQHTLNYHELMLSDRVRNQTFHKALKKHVKEGVSVMDIGSGTGIWAIAAAKLGAARVVAIEKENILIPLIEKLAAKNGVSDRVEVVSGDSREANIEGKFDVIVTETVGNDAFDEGIVPTIIDAKKRFLKKGGVVIPEALAAMAAPAHLKGRAGLPAGIKLQYRYFELLSQDIPKKIIDPSKLKLLGAPATLAHVDLARVTEPPLLTDMKCKWELEDGSKFNCLVVWAKILLTKDVSLDTINHIKAWTPVCLPVDPLEKGPASIECTITISNRQYYWIVSHMENGRTKVQSHSPVFPYTAIQTHVRSGSE